MPSLSILYRVLRCLVGLLAVLLRRDLGKDAELLVPRHENTILRRQLPRARYTPADRIWLAASLGYPRAAAGEKFSPSPLPRSSAGTANWSPDAGTNSRS
jgi:hypothetical protein